MALVEALGGEVTRLGDDGGAGGVVGGEPGVGELWKPQPPDVLEAAREQAMHSGLKQN